MLLSYENFSTSDLQGSTQADFLISIEADFHMEDRSRVICDEPMFPIVELAQQLSQWLEHGHAQDFEFVSMSFEERGVVNIRKHRDSWTFGSAFAPDIVSAPTSWPEVERATLDFIARVRHDLNANGIDPGAALQT